VPGRRAASAATAREAWQRAPHGRPGWPRVELAGQVQPPPAPRRKFGHLAAAEARVAGEAERPAGGPPEHQARQQPHQLGRGPVGQPALAVVLLGAAQGDRGRQRPGPLREGEAGEHGPGDPLVPPAPGGVAAAAGRAAAARLGVGLPAGVLGGGVVARQGNRPRGPVAAKRGAGQGAARRRPDRRARGGARRPLGGAARAGRPAVRGRLVAVRRPVVRVAARAGSWAGPKVAGGKAGASRARVGAVSPGMLVRGPAGAASWSVRRPHDTARGGPFCPPTTRAKPINRLYLPL
jgi:hypothetical protein